MEYIKYIFNSKFNSYTYFDANSYGLNILGNFLTSDVICGSSSWKEWMLDPTQNSSAGNITNIEKEDNYIILSDLFSEQPDGGPYLKISIDELIKIFNQWQNFCKTRPKEILITRKDDVITMEAKE